VLENVVIAQAHHAYAKRRQMFLARAVIEALGIVHRTVQLEGEPQLSAGEVDDVASDDVRSTELPSAKPPTPQRRPRHGLGGRRCSAHRARLRELVACGSGPLEGPHPNPCTPRHITSPARRPQTLSPWRPYSGDGLPHATRRERARVGKKRPHD
jgi:hypothetical protein